MASKVFVDHELVAAFTSTEGGEFLGISVVH